MAPIGVDIAMLFEEDGVRLQECEDVRSFLEGHSR
jgi:hypothetical protein